MKKKIVLKIGSSTLTNGTNRISRGKIEDIARQIVTLRDDYDIVLVSSGAIATARQFVSVGNWDNIVESKQALSAIGQPKLIQIYNEVFSDFDLRIAQSLLTYRDFENDNSRINTLNTLNELLKHNYIPIINENDTVSVEEITFGDNDKLSGLVAALVEADMLVLASDIDGLFDKNPHVHTDAKLIKEINNLNDAKNYIEDRQSDLGTGGMQSKLQAAEICFKYNISMYIVNGSRANFLVDTLSGKSPFTKFTVE